MGPMALRPIRRTKQWLSVLLKDTSVTAGVSNPHSDDQMVYYQKYTVLLNLQFVRPEGPYIPRSYEGQPRLPDEHKYAPYYQGLTS